MHESSLKNMRMFIERYMDDEKPYKILDIGSQNVTELKEGSYKFLFEKSNWQYHGLDVEKVNNVDIVVKDAYNWMEIPTNSFDIVVSGQCLEHVEYPWLSVAEISRVLKPGGICCIIVPSSGHYHAYPIDCWRFFPESLDAMSRSVGITRLDGYTDNKDASSDPEWKDTVFIGMKNKQTIFTSIRLAIKRKALKFGTL